MKPKALPDRPLAFLHLGDSYTIGEGVSTGKSWPAQMRWMLEVKGKRYSDMKILAQTGWTTGDLVDAIQSEGLEPVWDVVTLCIGVNNQYQGLSVDPFRKDLHWLLDKASDLSRLNLNRVVLLSIPDWSVTPFASSRDTQAIASEIRRFNEAARDTARQLNVPFIDWTSLSQMHADEENAFVEDGLHPSAQQYERWANFLLQHLAH